MTFETTIEIDAPAERVWGLLCDLPGYARWNSAVVRIDGKAAPGGRISVESSANPGRAFDLGVQVFEPPLRMVWLSRMPLGAFAGERVFTLTPTGQGVRFEMRESFTGWMAGLITRSIPDLQPSFDAWARDLKAAAETGVQDG